MSTYRITEASPALFIILIDQSYSMSEYHAKDRRSTNAEIAADAANRMIFSLGLHSLSSSSKTQQIKDKFEVSVIGYGGMGDDAMAVSAFQGSLEGRWAGRISEIFENSIDEDR